MNEDKPKPASSDEPPKQETEREFDDRKAHAMGAKLQKVARSMDKRLQQIARAAGFKPWGFTLLVIAFDGPELAYISNCDRVDMIRSLREQADNLEAGGINTVRAFAREAKRQRPN